MAKKSGSGRKKLKEGEEPLSLPEDARHDADPPPESPRSTNDYDTAPVAIVDAADFEDTQKSTPNVPLDDLPREKPRRLIVISHPDASMLGRRFDLPADGGVLIGRSTEVAVSFPGLLAVSRKHAHVYLDGDQMMIADLGSRNGTFVNAKKVERPTKLFHGDQVRIESVHLRFVSETDVQDTFHETIYGLVTLDDLTGIHNRRKYEEDVERDFARAKRHGRELAMIVFDIDEFKEINDRFGHLAGDAVLQELAQRVSKHMRRDGLFARIGGDEFVIVCPESGAAGAKVLAERLRGAVAAAPFVFAGSSIPVTCSFGVAELTADMRSASDLYAAADGQLYAAKAGGRNQVA